MKKILLCPPTYFNIDYEINPWMHIENKVTKKTALDEYHILKQTYTDLGVEILEIPPQKGVPDMVYTANLGFAIGDTFIPANFKYPQRQKENAYSEPYFKNLGYKIKKLPQDVTWEGEGDFLMVGDKYYMGYGKRSDIQAQKYLEEILKAPITPLKLIDPYFYHLDMCFLPLNPKAIAINKRSFEPQAIKTLKKTFETVIEVDGQDNQFMSCNAEVINKTIVVAQGISNELKTKYKSLGYQTQEIPMDEYRKGGGSIKCLTLEFH